ncbi:MAG TPA: hypothetical protein VF164_09185 [Trueperaceae bacterium]
MIHGREQQTNHQGTNRGAKRYVHTVCDGCGATESLAIFPDGHETLCPSCANKRFTSDLAAEHLAWQVAALLPAWREHWLARGAEPAWLEELVENIADALMLNDGERAALGFPPTRPVS